MGLVVRKPVFAYVKTKMQISCTVPAKLISSFVFATWIVQSILYIHQKFPASSHILYGYSLLYIRPEHPFSYNKAQLIIWYLLNNLLLKVTNAVDFNVTLEDEGKIMTCITNELHTMTVEIKQKLAEVEEGVERERSELKRDIEHGEEEIKKV